MPFRSRGASPCRPEGSTFTRRVRHRVRDLAHNNQPPALSSRGLEEKGGWEAFCLLRRQMLPEGSTGKTFFSSFFAAAPKTAPDGSLPCTGPAGCPLAGQRKSPGGGPPGV